MSIHFIPAVSDGEMGLEKIVTNIFSQCFAETWINKNRLKSNVQSIKLWMHWWFLNTGKGRWCILKINGVYHKQGNCCWDTGNFSQWSIRQILSMPQWSIVSLMQLAVKELGDSPMDLQWNKCTIEVMRPIQPCQPRIK